MNEVWIYPIGGSMPLHVGRASVITLKTMPYILLRLLVYSLFAIGLMIYFWIVYGIGQAALHWHENARLGVWIVALILPFPITRLLREYVLYVLRAGHVAVITELATIGHLPEGVGQIAWGREQVFKTFKEVSVLFMVDRLVLGVINSINGIMQTMGNVFSAVPGIQGLIRFAQVILKFSLTYVDEAILARNFRMKNETVWQSAQSGLILYAQSWKEIVQAAIFLGFAAIFSYGVLLILFLVPLWGVGVTYPDFKLFFIGAAFLLAWAVKLALFDPWAMTNMILVYLTVTEGKTPDPAWEAKLETVSGKFKKIQNHALQKLS